MFNKYTPLYNLYKCFIIPPKKKKQWVKRRKVNNSKLSGGCAMVFPKPHLSTQISTEIRCIILHPCNPQDQEGQDFRFSERMGDGCMFPVKRIHFPLPWFLPERVASRIFGSWEAVNFPWFPLKGKSWRCEVWQLRGGTCLGYWFWCRQVHLNQWEDDLPTWRCHFLLNTWGF